MPVDDHLGNADRPSVMVVLPAYNAEKTLEKTILDIPRGAVDRILVVDDGSTDNTVAIARSLGLELIVHEKNRGYGANQKTCYDKVLSTDADIVVLLHPDYQYDARLIPAFVHFLQTDVCDIMLGNRIRTRKETLKCGMPVWKYISNRTLTIFENLLLGQNLGEWHSGFRVFKRKVLETIPYQQNSDDFVFDTQFLVQATHYGFKIGDAPVPVRYFEEASSINFARSLSYGLETLKVVFAYKCVRWGMFSVPWIA